MDRFLEVDEVVANGSTFIEEISDELALIMRQWVWFAMRDIGPSYELIETSEINVVDNSVAKPLDMTGNPIELGVYDESGNEIPYRYNYSGGRVFTKRDWQKTIDIYEDATHIHFSDFERQPSYAVLKYFKMPLSDCNEPLVPESHLNAVVAYLKFAFYWRQGTNPAMIGMARNMWEQERLKIRSKNKSVAGLRAKQMVKEWMSIIPNPKFNRF